MNLVLLFLKNAVCGQVKTRLAAAVGESVALDLYRNFVLDTLDAVRTSGSPFRLCLYPPDQDPSAMSWLGSGLPWTGQQGGNLGQRMQHAFEQAFLDGAERVVLIGSDLPDLPASFFRIAFDALDRRTPVIGPASDGGYYLIGFTRDGFLPAVFHDIPWGTNEVFSRTMRLLEHSGSSAHVLPVWHDIDTGKDLAAFYERNTPGGGGHRTMECIARQCLYRP